MNGVLGEGVPRARRTIDNTPHCPYALLFPFKACVFKKAEIQKVLSEIPYKSPQPSSPHTHTHTHQNFAANIGYDFYHNRIMII